MHWCIVIVYRGSPIAEINDYCRVAAYPRHSTHPVSLKIKEGMNFFKKRGIETATQILDLLEQFSIECP